MEREAYEKIPSYPPSSSMQIKTLMKRLEVTLEDMKNADKWKTKVINMLEAKFASIISKSSTDVGRTNLHTVDLQVNDGSPMFVKQYAIPLKYQSFIDEETKWLEEAGLISRLVHSIIKIFHDNRGHQGISRTINMIKRRFWFRKM